MAVYKLKKTGRNLQKVEVRAEKFEIHVPALIICLLLAFVIWLYVVNFRSSATEKLPGESIPTSEPAESVAASVAILQASDI